MLNDAVNNASATLDTHPADATTPAGSPMRVHPAAELFPFMDQVRLAQLEESIRENGQRSPIVRWKGLILDGRNRYLACGLAGVEPRFIEWDGIGSPWRFVWDQNGQRRDLPADQRVAIRHKVKQADQAWHAEQAQKSEAANRARSEAARAQPRAIKPDGRGGFSGPVPNETGPEGRSIGRDERERDRLAAETGTSPATAGRVLAVAHARPNLFEQVADGTLSAMEAQRIAKREAVAAKCSPLPIEARYRVIYADPPWQYHDTRAGLAGYAATAAADHYPTMSVAELSALDVGALADEDAVLFCWATSPLLPDALTVIRAWGFTYKTLFVWAKGRPNFGHYHNANAELLVVATRGSCLPEAETREDQVQGVERTGRHSAKPEHFRVMIDRLYASGRRIELFRRGSVPAGWESWGNEARAPGAA